MFSMPQTTTHKERLVSYLPGQHDLLALHQAHPARYPFFLESVAHATDGSCQSRYDILFAFPQQTLRLNAQCQLEGLSSLTGNDFLDNLDRWWQAERTPGETVSELPFSGGWFLFLGYELAAQIEPRLQLPLPAHLPIACATRIPAAIIFDHETKQTACVAEPAYATQFTQMMADLKTPPVSITTPSNYQFPIEEDAPQRYLAAVEKVKHYIVEGDVFQVNLSRAWVAQNTLQLNAAQLYQRLRQSNPAPFAGLVHYDEFAIISSSPERLISVRKGEVDTRPIAGTRRRDQRADNDAALKQELIAHPKERAEHIMLIDLERNDLGRVCQPGSIQVNELMVLESYAHVHHIVSNVHGELRTDVSPGQVIRAVFPGGTITGCPKERCMAIIAELEQTARGAYTGSMGYLNHNGDMDLNILIRTLTLQDDTISFRAGAGLVADSQAEAELEETRHKARGMLLALQG